MKNTLWLYKNPYQIEIIDETNLDDNQKALTRYQERQPYDREIGDYDQLIGIRLYENEEPMGKVLLVADTYNVLNEKGDSFWDNDRLFGGLWLRGILYSLTLLRAPLAYTGRYGYLL